MNLKRFDFTFCQLMALYSSVRGADVFNQTPQRKSHFTMSLSFIISDKLIIVVVVWQIEDIGIKKDRS